MNALPVVVYAHIQAAREQPLTSHGVPSPVSDPFSHLHEHQQRERVGMQAGGGAGAGEREEGGATDSMQAGEEEGDSVINQRGEGERGGGGRERGGSPLLLLLGCLEEEGEGEGRTGGEGEGGEALLERGESEVRGGDCRQGLRWEARNATDLRMSGAAKKQHNGTTVNENPSMPS